MNAIRHLVDAGHDAPALLQAATRALARAVPFDAAAVGAVDPDTLVWTSGVMRGVKAAEVLPVLDELLLDGGSNAGGRLQVACVAGGRCFGVIHLSRAGARRFSPRDAELLDDVARTLGEGLRAALSRARPARAAAAGMLVVDDELRVLSATEAAITGLVQLGECTVQPDRLPAVVQAVDVRARRRAQGRPGPPARARVPTRSGVTFAVHASALLGDRCAWAVGVEPARSSDALHLLADGHDLTPREREALGWLLRGQPDKVIAERLRVSPNTAREYAGRVLQKFDVRTRAQLQSLLFDDPPTSRLTVGARTS
jgi:DNA-binding CsgD family transcriptional regulator